VAENIVVPVAQVVNIDFTLQMGNIAESVTVTSEAPLLTTASSEVGNAISPQEFTTLPMPIDDGARQLMTFIYSSLPGAVGGSWNGSINGGQYFTTEILIEGLPMARYDLQGSISETTPSADAASEFKVQMSSFSAEYGNTGGGVANFGMKSGTNDFHGSVYEYLANPIFNATPWRINALEEGNVSKVKPKNKENNYGVTFGGPIRKNKTFFFFNYEGDNLRQGNPSRWRTAPTLAMRDSGDFSAFLGTTSIGTDALGRPVYAYEIYDPTSTRETAPGSKVFVRDGFGFDPVTGLPGPNANVIPQAYWSVASAKMLPMFPTPVNDKLRNNYVAYSGHPTLDVQKWSLKLDQVINDKHKLSGFFTYSHRKRLMGRGGRYYFPLPGYPLDATKIQEIPVRLFRLSEDWTISGSTVNHFAIGYNRFGNANGYPSGDVSNWVPSKLGITGVPDVSFPRINFSSRGNLLDQWGSWGFPGFNANESYVYSDTLSHVRGKHSFKVGAEIIRYRMNDRYIGGQSGTFSFHQQETGLPGALRNVTGHPFASFILGGADGGNASLVTTTPGWRQLVYTFYAQDDWKLTPKLTLNYGLRWDIPTPQKEVRDRMTSFDPTMANPGADNILGAMAAISNCQGCIGGHSFASTYWKEFSPRFGFAYSLTQKLVWRGGYGISYSPPIANGWPGASSGFNGSIPFGSRGLYPTQFGNAADPVLYWSALTNAPIPGGARVGVPPSLSTLPNLAPDAFNYQWLEFQPRSIPQPYVQNWNFGFQYMLPAEILVEANYVGTKGTHLIANNIGAFYNQANPKYLAMGTAVGSDGTDIYDMYLGDALDATANPDTAAMLATFGITGPPFPSFAMDNLVSQAIKRYPQFDSIGMMFANMGSSTYHAMQLTVRKRGGHGLNFIASYTLSKTLTNSDAALGGYYSGYVYAQNFYQPGLEKSIASFDYPQFLKLTWIYDLPLGRGKRWLNSGGALDKLLGGWHITGIQQYYSGNPLEIFDSNLRWTTSIGNGGVRGDVLPGVNQVLGRQGQIDSNNGSQYLNPDAFADPPLTASGVYPLRLGTAPRRLPNVRGPAHQSEDFGILKDTKLTERFVLKFRADFFNVFNRTGWGDPGTDLAYDFGKVFGVAHGPRNIQMSLRLDF